MTGKETDARDRIWLRNLFLWLLVFMLAALSFSFMAGIVGGGGASPGLPYGSRKP